MSGHGAAPAAYTLEDIAAVFSWTRDKKGRANVRCGWCNATTRRVVAPAATRWFVEHPCASPFAAPLRQPLTPVEQPDYLFRLTERQAAAAWELMQTMSEEIRTYGGRRTRLASPTSAQVEHARRVDVLLTRILVSQAKVFAFPQVGSTTAVPALVAA